MRGNSESEESRKAATAFRPVPYFEAVQKCLCNTHRSEKPAKDINDHNNKLPHVAKQFNPIFKFCNLGSHEASENINRYFSLTHGEQRHPGNMAITHNRKQRDRFLDFLNMQLEVWKRRKTEGLSATRGMFATATFPFSSQGWIMEKFICGPHSVFSSVQSGYDAYLSCWTAGETDQNS